MHAQPLTEPALRQIGYKLKETALLSRLSLNPICDLNSLTLRRLCISESP